jgi:hypothetical protein
MMSGVDYSVLKHGGGLFHHRAKIRIILDKCISAYPRDDLKIFLGYLR